MNTNLYACVHAAELPTQALLRLNTQLASLPVAVLDGRPPLQIICSLNRHARIKGVSVGMTRLEAESIPDLQMLPRSPETEAAARTVLHECAAHFSPRIEAASPQATSQATAAACILDITGTERLFGQPHNLSTRLRAALETVGLRSSIAVSTNFHTARIKAASSRGIAIIADGQEAQALSKLPLAVLDLPPDPAETLAIWGIRTLGELAALPESELVARLGPQAVYWRNLASGALPHTFQPIEAEFSLKEFCDFDTPIENQDSLLFIGARMIDCLVARAATRALSLASLKIEMRLEGCQTYQRNLRPAIPTIDCKFLLKLLQLEIAAHPPQSAVLTLTLTAEAGQSSKVQLGLFAPQTPEPSRLDVTIARIKAIAGEDRVGSPVLEDSHRPGSFRMQPFAVPTQTNKAPASLDNSTPHPYLALRRIRPPVPVRVQLQAQQPVAFRSTEQAFRISAAYGPWKTSGNWWSTEPWNSEEWDVLAENPNGNSVACLLVHNCDINEWQLEAYYD